MAKLLQDRYFWLIVTLLGIGSFLIYFTDAFLLGETPTEHPWHSTFLLARSLAFLVAAAVAARRFGFKGGLVVALAATSIMVPHALLEVKSPQAIIILTDISIVGLLAVSFSWIIGRQKQAEEAMRASEQWLSTTLRSIGDAVIASDAKGCVTLMNPVAQTLTGWNEEDATGKPLKDVFNIINEQTGKQAENPVARVIREGVVVGLANHTVLIAKDGSKRPVDDSGAPIRDDKGNITGVILVFRDITERKQMEHDIGERLKELQCLYSISQISERAEIGLNEVCQEVADLLPPGWQYPEITCSRITVNEDAFPTENYRDTEWKQCADIKVRGVKTGMVEVGYLEERPAIDEGPFLKEERALINAVAEHLAEIIQRKQMEETLRKSEVKFKGLVTNVKLGIFRSTQGPPGRFLEVNPAMEEITGYSREELLKINVSDLYVHPEKRGAMLEEIASVTGKLTKELHLRKKDETEIVISDTKVAAKDDKGKVIFFDGIIEDITERRRAEEREKQLQAEISHSSRLAAIGELAAGVAHEINNPLTGILGFSELLLNKSTDSETSRRLERIHSEAKRAAKVVENLLTFARHREPNREHADINDILQRALELRAYELKTGNIKVTVELAPDLPEVTVDSLQIQEVFLNIILNAEHAMIEANGGGKLDIQTQQIKGFIRVSFADDGPGIPAEQLGKLFDPFFTTRGEEGGTGLGLSICHGIVTEHGGKIYARSKPGRGATFFVELPIRQEG